VDIPAALLRHGIDEFNRGRFFEAHELWEEAWGGAEGEEKRFFQGLTQIAAGYHKLSLSQYNGARKLLGRGQQILQEFPSDFAGIDIVFLLETVAITLNDLRSCP
jgi:predicted metal-dependent hydrolase